MTMTHTGVIVILFPESFMAFLIPAIFFFFGLAIGSFLNVAIIRGEAREGLGGRSRCRQCGRTLGVWELMPVASYVLQGGRCRGCQKPISLQYPLVELATALVFAGIAWYFLPPLYSEDGTISAIALLGGSVLPLSYDGGAAISALVLMGLSVMVSICAGLVILVSDLRFQIIPDGAVFALGLAGIAASLGRASPGRDVAAAVGCALFFFLLWFLSRGRWMGFGDVKLVAATSLLVGYPDAIAALLFAFWLGGIIGGALLLAGKKQWGSRIPFGPFILAGAAAAWLWGGVFFAFTGLSGVL